MTTLLDAYAVVALLRGEPAAREVIDLLAADGGIEIHPLNLAEVIDRLARLDGVDPDDVEADVALLGIHTSAAPPDVVVAAGALRARHYDRNECAVSMADCVAAAHAIRHGMALATSDPHLAAVVATEGAKVHGLVDRRGRRPPS
jgi:predicted nucleic acid-binding protein